MRSLRLLLVLVCGFYLAVVLLAYYSLIYHADPPSSSSASNSSPSLSQNQPIPVSLDRHNVKIPQKGAPEVATPFIPSANSQSDENKPSAASSDITEQFTAVAEGTYVFSVFLDTRDPAQAFLKIMFLKYRSASPSLWCHYSGSAIQEGGSQPMTNLKNEKFQFYEHAENHAMPYGGYMGVCVVPASFVASLTHVAITTASTPPPPSVLNSPISATNLPVRRMLDVSQQKTPYKFGLCVPALFGSLNAQHLFEFFSVVRQLGVEHVTIYLSNAPPEVNRVLHHFSQLGQMTVIPWKMPVSGQQSWNEAQILNVNDCLYRSMSLYEYTMFHDIDEFLVPRVSVASYTKLTERFWSAQPNLCGLCFRSAFFEPKWSAAAGEFRIPTSTMRTNSLSQVRTKCLVQPRRIHELGIHHISKPYQEHFTSEKPDGEQALLHHYRQCDSMWGMNCEGKVKDDTLVTYFDEAQVEMKWRMFLQTLGKRDEPLGGAL